MHAAAAGSATVFVSGLSAHGIAATLSARGRTVGLHDTYRQLGRCSMQSDGLDSDGARRQD